MDAKQFLAEFGHIANAPDGIQKLRELTLQLAIQGKLVIQDETDFSVRQNLGKIYKEKTLLAKKDKFKPFFNALEEYIENTEFNIPNNWTWCYLDNLAAIARGGSPRPIKSFLTTSLDGENWIKISDSKRGSMYIDSAKERILVDGVKKSRKVYPEDMILSNSMSFGYPYILKISGCIHDGWLVLRLPNHLINKLYIYYLLLSPYSKQKFTDAASGAVVQNLNADKVKQLPVPLPPLEEQSRIIAKVDELMTLCDKLETQQQQKRKLQNYLRQSTLQALADAGKPEELQECWGRLAGNFSHLFAEAEDVVSFKGLILDLAVSGHLLNFTAPHEKTGRSLLEEINEERLKWATESEDQELKEAQTMIRKIKKQKLIYPDSPLPQNWVWGSFLEISQAVIDCHNKTAPYVSNGIHLIRTSDIRDGKMDLRNTKKITEETYDYWSRRMPPRAGDVFFTREAPMGEVALVPEGDKVCLGQRTMLLRLFPNLFNNQFLVYVIQSPSFQKRMLEAGVGMTVKHLRVGGVEDLVVPVPPKDEQDKIVTLIGKLFEICDGFAKQLKLERQISANLAATSVATLTGITNTQQEAPMKAPKTELKAPVRLGKNQPSGTTKAPLASLLSRHNGEMNANDLWQRFGGEIDAFYAQLKTEVSQGWIAEPKGAEMLEREAD